MKVKRLILATKNNVRNGFYMYIPIVLIDGCEYYCKHIRTNRILKKTDIDINSLVVTRLINN